MTPEGNMAPQPGWWSRNWKWALPVGCLGIVASCMCFGAIAAFMGFNAVKKNTGAEQALAIATSDSEVQAVLGPPIHDEGNWQSSVQYVNGQKSARFAIPLKGTKAEGVLRVDATGVGDDWTYQVLQVEVPGQPPIDLMDKVGGERQPQAPPTPGAAPPTGPDEQDLQQDPQDEEDEAAPLEDGKKDGEHKPDINL